MKNTAKKVIAVSLGICILTAGFIFLFFVTKPYTEKKVVIWLPDNYELENIVSSDEVVSIIPNLSASRQSNLAVVYSEVDLDLFKIIVGKNNNEKVAVSIEDASPSSNGLASRGFYRVIYKIKYPIDNNKSVIVLASECHKYNTMFLSEMKLNSKTKTLLLKHKRNILQMSAFFSFGFLVIALAVFIYILVLNTRSKQQSNN